MFSIVAISTYIPTVYRRVPFSSCLLQYILFVDFFNDGHSNQWEVLAVALIYFSLIISNVEHLFLFC